MTNDELRQKFHDKGLTYEDIGSREIAKLRRIIEQELSIFQNDRFRMRLHAPRKKDVSYDKFGSIKRCFFKVKGWAVGETPYFKEREGISFNGGGFIGFAGWADSDNIEPFKNAFLKWLDYLPNKTRD